VDGAEVARDTFDAVSPGNKLNVQIGCNGPASGKNLTGKLDDVRICRTVRSGGEIQAHFGHELAAIQPGLVVNWQFEMDGPAFDSVGIHGLELREGAGDPASALARRHPDQ
jgi:hypothetical protein